MKKQPRKKRKKAKQDWFSGSFKKENQMIKEARYKSLPGYACAAYCK